MNILTGRNLTSIYVFPYYLDSIGNNNANCAYHTILFSKYYTYLYNWNRYVSEISVLMYILPPVSSSYHSTLSYLDLHTYFILLQWYIIRKTITFSISYSSVPMVIILKLSVPYNTWAQIYVVTWNTFEMWNMKKQNFVILITL